jgi:hypothetical protein
MVKGKGIRKNGSSSLRLFPASSITKTKFPRFSTGLTGGLIGGIGVTTGKTATS